MYQLGLNQRFESQHYLTGGDWGAENQLHSHPYRVEWTLGGPALDPHGYLLDLNAVQTLQREIVATVAGKVLNDLPAFQSLNPSVERLARHLSDSLLAARDRWDPERRLESSMLRVWEDDDAWASWAEVL